MTPTLEKLEDELNKKSSYLFTAIIKISYDLISSDLRSTYQPLSYGDILCRYYTYTFVTVFLAEVGKIELEELTASLRKAILAAEKRREENIELPTETKQLVM